jgi:hypothetical protein
MAGGHGVSSGCGEYRYGINGNISGNERDTEIGVSVSPGSFRVILAYIRMKFMPDVFPPVARPSRGSEEMMSIANHVTRYRQAIVRQFVTKTLSS